MSGTRFDARQLKVRLASRTLRAVGAELGARGYVDPEARTLSASKLVDGHWLELAVHGDSDVVRVEPFPDVELALGEWWAGLPPTPG